MTKLAPIASLLLLLAQPLGAETLREAIALAYESNPLLAEARERQFAQEELTEQSRAEGRLNVTADATIGYDSIGRGEAAIGQVSADLPIWTGGRVGASVRAARLEEEAGDQRVRDVEAQVLERLVVAYADVLFAQQSVDVARIGIARLEQQIDEAQARFDLGDATLTDVAQLRTQRASVVANLGDAEASLATAVAAYREVVGQEPGELEEAVPTPSLPEDLSSARDIARARNPVLLEQARIAGASGERVARARAERRPFVSLSGGYGRGVQLANDNLRGFESAANVGLTVTMPILNGGLLNSRVREAQAIERAEEYAVEATEREVVRAVETAWSRLQAAEFRLEASKDGLEAAELALNGVKAEYEFGLRSTIDILIAEESFRAAQLAIARSRSDLLIEQARLLRSTGLLERSAYL
ncbi:MAG: TolC family outer membrane protein [Erythrobacter sp.]|nr:TolC family outer membrane protein [Erythrobacter sp.]